MPSPRVLYAPRRRGLMLLGVLGLWTSGCSHTPGDPDADALPRSDVGIDAAPSAACLGIAAEAPTGITYSWLDDDGTSYFEVVDALSDGAHVLVLVRRFTDPNVACLAAIGGDLRPAWSMRVPAERRTLAHIRDRPHLVGVDAGQVVRREVDVSTGEVGPEQISAGFTDTVEWARVAGRPDGAFCVAWNEGWAIHTATYAPDGSPLGPPRVLSTNGRYPRVGADGARFVVGYHELRSGAVSGPVVALLDEAGALVAGPIYPDGPVFGGASFFAHRTSDGLIAAWAHGGAVRIAPLDASMMPLTEPTSVPTLARAGTDSVYLRAMVSTPRGTLLAYHDVRSRRGGVALVSRSAPPVVSVLFDRDGWQGLQVGVIGDTVLAFRGGERLSAQRVEL